MICHDIQRGRGFWICKTPASFCNTVSLPVAASTRPVFAIALLLPFPDASLAAAVGTCRTNLRVAWFRLAGFHALSLATSRITTPICRIRTLLCLFTHRCTTSLCTLLPQSTGRRGPSHCYQCHSTQNYYKSNLSFHKYKLFYTPDREQNKRTYMGKVKNNFQNRRRIPTFVGGFSSRTSS